MAGRAVVAMSWGHQLLSFGSGRYTKPEMGGCIAGTWRMRFVLQRGIDEE